MMKEKKHTLSLKTRTLNRFRAIFKLYPFEKLLVFLVQATNSFLVGKLVPPNYLYADPTPKSYNRNSMKLQLNISNVVDHYLYFGFKDVALDNLFEKTKQGDLILDIGANIGYTIVKFGQLAKQGRVFGFEPDPLNNERAMKHIQLNGLENIKLFKLGLGDQGAELKLHRVNSLNPGMNRILAASEESSSPYETIQVKTLDTVVEEQKIEKIDIIKIDVEGFEQKVLMGGRVCIKKHFPILFIELIDANLKEHGFSAHKTVTLIREMGYSTILNANTMTAISDEDLESSCYDIMCFK